MRNNQRMVFAGAGGNRLPLRPEFLRFSGDTFKDQLTRYTRTNDFVSPGYRPGVIEDTVWAKATDMTVLYSPHLLLGTASVITQGTGDVRISGTSSPTLDATSLHLPPQEQFSMDARKGYKGFKVVINSMTDYADRDPVGLPDKIVGSYSLLHVVETGGPSHLDVRVIDFGNKHTFYILAPNPAGGAVRSESISVAGLYDANKPVKYVFNYTGTKAVLDIHHPQTGVRVDRLEFRGLRPYDDKGQSVMQFMFRTSDHGVLDVRTSELYSLEVHRTPDAD